jgi:hypothetical protein
MREIERRRPLLSAKKKWLAADDRDVGWLVPRRRGFIEARFCRLCAPAGSIVDAACSRAARPSR